jgi:hypothetical protein
MGEAYLKWRLALIFNPLEDNMPMPNHTLPGYAERLPAAVGGVADRPWVHPDDAARTLARTAAAEQVAPSHCPTCGHSLEHPANRFHTGSAATVNSVDAPLDPDGELAYDVRVRLREGQSRASIAAVLDLTDDQIAGVAAA